MTKHTLDTTSAVTRSCFTLRVRPEVLDVYRSRHLAVWPEMLRALRDTGWARYSLFSRPDGLVVGYVESEDLERSRRAMADLSVNDRWQAQMASFFTGLDGRRPDEGFELLDPVFVLDDQLAELEVDQG